MRVTDGMSSIMNEANIKRAQYDLLQRQQQASSGMRVEKPSDDPTAASRVVSLDAERQATAQHLENVERSLSQLALADNALGEAANLMVRARELAVQMANQTLSADSRAQAVAEVQAIRDQLVVLGNSRYGDVHIFSGYLTEDAPFDNSGASVSYVGDTNQRRVLGDDGRQLEVGIDGQTAFMTAGGRDVFADLDAFATALGANDLTGIRDALDSLEEGDDQLIQARVTVGGQYQRAASQLELLENRRVRQETERPALVEADAVETLSGLVGAQQTLNRTLQVTAQMLQTLSLVDRL